jgi:hypothetical protein
MFALIDNDQVDAKPPSFHKQPLLPSAAGRQIDIEFRHG